MDALLAVVVTGVLGTVIATQGGTPIAYAWAVALGALLLARRSYPRAVLVVSALSLFGYYAAEQPAVGIAVPLAAALWSAADAGRAGTAAVTSAGVLAVSLVFRLREGDDPGFVLGYDLTTNLILMVVAIALGDAVRSRRVQRDQQRELARRETESRVREERLAVARDLHDSLGHALAVISLHAEVAREADDAGPALREVQRAASEALRELRSTVGLLRRERPVSLADLDTVLDTARAAGFDVDVTVVLPELPAAVDEVAYRVVQEGVTNVVRHAEASRVEVSVTEEGGRLRITVADDGSRTAAGASGHGLAGLAERAAELGGRVRTRRGPRGFVLEAELPLFLSPATARTYVGRLLVKLQARDRTQLAVVAHRAGLA
uniref:histidine kinase n=1 Tax=Actinoplanes sp. RD1 TaxID=3064538 RepID=UPI0027426CAD|nr:histidine kinase [Actinoplanes sp. RD1]